MAMLARRGLASRKSLCDQQVAVTTCSLLLIAVLLTASGSSNINAFTATQLNARSLSNLAVSPSVAPGITTKQVEARYGWSTCVLAAIGLVAALKPQYVKRSKNFQVVATRALPIMSGLKMAPVQVFEAAMPEVLPVSAPTIVTKMNEISSIVLTTPLITFESSFDTPSLAGSFQESRSSQRSARGSTSQNSGAEQKARSRRSRRKVGHRLRIALGAVATHSEPRVLSFEPSKVSLKLQRAVQSHRFPTCAGSRETKCHSEGSSLAGSHDVGGLHSFNIKSLGMRMHTTNIMIVTTDTITSSAEMAAWQS